MKYVWLATLAVCLLLFLTCSKNVGVNNTKNETRTIPAMLYNPGGSPAVHAKVRFFPINYNPHTGGLSKKLATADSATTDSTGNYSVKLDTGTYNVLASGDSGVVYQDSITVTKDSAIHPPADTLKIPGGLRGKVRLQPGDDARTVFILFMGTNTWGTPDDSTGKFTVTNMAQGTYKVRVLTTLDAYVPKDTVLSVTAGAVDTLAHDIVLKYTGVPGPTGLTVSYDTLRQTVILAWTGADTSMIAGYNVYRAIKGQNFSLITPTPLPDTVTTYRDSTVTVGTTYQYEVVSRNASGLQSTAVLIPGDTMKVVSSSLVTTTFTSNLINAISDTASINDTIKVCLTYSNPTRKIVKVVWYADSLNSPIVRQKADSSLTGKDTLTYSWNQTGNKKIFVKATDGAGTVWTDTLGVVVIQDVPVITFLSSDTIVNHGGTVRCSVYVQQEFGTMTVGIDTANSGTFKGLGGLGLSGGKSYSFSTGGACTWDSVKVRVTDSKGNVVTKGFKVQIRISPPTIQKTNSDTTVAIKDSVTFNVSAIDSFGGITQIAWDFDGNGVYDWTSPTLQNSGYRYQTAGLYKAVLRLTDECQKLTYDTVRVTVLQDVPVVNAGADTTVSIKDTIKLHGSASHQFGTIAQWAWDIGNTGTFKVTSSGDTNIIAPSSQNLNYLCVLRVTDSHGNVAKDTVKITVLQDVPVIDFLSADTVVNHGGTVRCSVYVQQQFGTMTVGIDTANSGNFKSLGGLGLSGGKSYSFSTGNACTWDSVKVRITDDDSNVVIRGFKVQLLYSPPVIQKVNPDTTITIKDSVTFYVSANAPDGNLTQVAWDFDGNGVYDWTSPTLQNSGYRYQTAGLYKAVLRLTDECQKLTYDTVRVTVVQDIPTINAGKDTTVNFGTNVNLHGTANDVYGKIVKYEWCFDGTITNFHQTSTGDTSIIPIPALSDFYAYFRVTNDANNVVVDSVHIKVYPNATTIFVDSVSGRSAYIRWNKALGNGFAEYIIYCSQTQTLPNLLTSNTIISNPNDTILRIMNLAVTTNYYFQIAIMDKDSLETYSTQVSAVTKSPWSAKANMLTKRDFVSSISVGGQIYAIGGSNGGGLTTNEEYDHTSNTWTTKANEPNGSSSESITLDTVNGKIYALGGYGGIAEYDPATDTWVTIGPLTSFRGSMASSVVNGKIYVIGGGDYSGQILSTVEEYDPVLNTWTTKASLPQPLEMSASVSLNGKIYVFGGIDTLNQGVFTVYEYDPGTDIWSTLPPMPTTAGYYLSTSPGISGASVINGSIFLVGSSGSYLCFLQYNPVSNTWVTGTSSPTARNYVSSTALNGKVYVIGGNTGNNVYLSTVEAYDPAIDQ